MIEAQLGLRAYYKGTSLQLPVCISKTEEVWKEIERKGENQVVKFLQMGVSLDELKEVYLEQLNEIEDGLCRTEDKSQLNGLVDQQEIVEKAIKGTRLESQGAEFATAIWFLNIAALLKMKVIENDNMNGWLITKLVE